MRRIGEVRSVRRVSNRTNLRMLWPRYSQMAEV
jgi:hypothetical protein